MYVLISKKTGKVYRVKEDGDFHCKEGQITKEDLESGSIHVQTNRGVDFLVTRANNHDRRAKMKRGPQILLEKDLGYIMARSGIDKNSFIVEAGGGSGSATTFFSKFASKVHSYEEKEDNISIIKKNLDLMESDNVELFQGRVEDYLEEEKDIDLLFLDMPEPWEVLEKDLSSVKRGSYIVCYLPSMLQIHSVVTQAIERDDLYMEEISEVTLREWKGSHKVLRPENRKEVDFTAFLIFIRKL